MVKFSRRAQISLKNFENIAKEGTREVVKKYLEELVRYTEVLIEQPYIGKKLFHRNEFIRQLIFKRHKIIYQIKGNEIFIISILHSRQDFQRFISEYIKNLKI